MVATDDLLDVRAMADSSFDCTPPDLDEDSIGGVLGRSLVGAGVGAAAGALMHATKKANKGVKKAFLGDRKRRYWEPEEQEGSLGGSIITNGLIGAGAAALAGGIGPSSSSSSTPQSTPKTESFGDGDTQLSRYSAEKAYRTVLGRNWKRPVLL